MGSKKKGKKQVLDKKCKNVPSMNNSAPAWNYSKKDLGGVIFGCTHHTINECLSKLIFGLPSIHFSYVKNIGIGLPIFLFNYSDRKLHGIYEATGQGQMHINPHGWTENGSDETQYPAQVCVCVRKQCHYLEEHQYKEVLRKNYYHRLDIDNHKVHFRFELDRGQTGELLTLFDSMPLTTSSAKFYHYASMWKPPYETYPNLDKRCTYQEFKTLPTDEGFSRQYMESDQPEGLPCSMGNWASLFKNNSDVKHEISDTKSLLSEANWDEQNQETNWDKENQVCLKELHIDQDPAGGTASWEEESWASDVCPHRVEGTVPSGIAPYVDEAQPEETQPAGVTDCWTKETYPSGFIPHWDDWEDETKVAGVTCCLEEETNPSRLTPCWNGEKHILESHSHSETIVAEEERVYSKLKQLADGREILRTDADNSNMESELEKVSVNSPENNFVIDQMRQELQELKAISMEQNRRIILLEKKLSDSGIPLLKSRFQSSSTVDLEMCNNHYNNELLTTPFDELRRELIFIMGGSDGLTWMSAVDCYSPSTDSVRSLKPMSFPRSCASAVVLNDFIYNIGGSNGDGNLWYDTVECYKPSSNEWITCPPLSQKKGCLSGVSLNNNIFAVGGGNGVDCFEEVEGFDPLHGRWIHIQPMLQKRFASAAAELDGSLYVVGGYDKNNYLKSAEHFDPRQGKWSMLQSMNTRRATHALSVLEGKLYAIGGYDGNTHVPSVEIFDPRMGSWLAGENMKQARGYVAAPVVGESIYVFGGLQEDNGISDSVEVFRLGYGWSITELKGIGKGFMFSWAVY